MCETKAIIITLPADILKRCREIDAVRRFLEAEKRRILGYVDNLELAEEVLEREISAILDEFSKQAVRQFGFEPDGIVYTYNLERGELIVWASGGEENGKNPGQDQG